MKLSIGLLLLFLSFNQALSSLYYAKGINQRKTESDVSQYINREDGKCKRTNAIIQKANQLTKNQKTTLDKAKAIFNFVKDKIGYTYYDNSQRGASTTLSRGSANCCDQANLIVALCRAVKIPVRYVHGVGCRFSSGTYGHVWTQILVDNIWYAADPTSVRNSFGYINNWYYKSFALRGIYALLSF